MRLSSANKKKQFTCCEAPLFVKKHVTEFILTDDPCQPLDKITHYMRARNS